MKIALARIGIEGISKNSGIWAEIPEKYIIKTLAIICSVTGRISDLAVYDTGKGEFEIMYRFVISGEILTVRTKISSISPKIPTCTELFPGALLFEREQNEMFGIEFTGHDGMTNVFFCKDTPKTPLRKEAVNARAGKKLGEKI